MCGNKFCSKSGSLKQIKAFSRFVVITKHVEKKQVYPIFPIPLPQKSG